MPAALAATTVCLLGMVAFAIGAGSVSLSYPAAHIRHLPDAGLNGDGVTAASAHCPSGHPHPTGGGAEITGADPRLDLEIKSTSPRTRSHDWHIEGNNSSGSAAQMAVFAICGSGDYR